METLWTKQSPMPRFPRLRGEVRADVLVIGGGLTGLLCARELAQAGAQVLLVEADHICDGTTKGTTAKITSQHGLLYHKLIRRFGTEKAGLYLAANQAALEKYRTLCRDIDCGFQEKDAYVYSLDNRKKLEQEVSALESLGVPAELTERPPLPLSAVGAVRFPNQAQFNPLPFAAAMAKDLRIYEHSPVLELGPHTARTAEGMIRAENIIIATHFPILNKHGAYFLKMYQRRSYVLALENAPDVDGMYLDEAEDGLSFRNAQNLLLLGGGGHRTGRRGGGWAALEDFAKRSYPQAKILCRWAAQDCMTLDQIPYIGPYAKGTEGLYTATGFNKWGMTSAMAAAGILADAVLGRENPYAALFSPSRSMLRPQLAANAAEATLSLLKPTAPRCPHMGCALTWNRREHSWDCPCHGSRFTETGVLLEGPATGDLRHPPEK